jgi:IMP dehydrogenase
MTTVAQLLEKKGRDVWFIHPGRSVYDAIAMMSDKSVGALPVMREDVLVGIISERDYARKVILLDRSSKSTLVHEIMSTPVVSVTEHQSVNDCLSIMTERRIRHLPVIDREALIGMISIGDLVKQIIAEQQGTIEQLERYIVSG